MRHPDWPDNSEAAGLLAWPCRWAKRKPPRHWQPHSRSAKTFLAGPCKSLVDVFGEVYDFAFVGANHEQLFNEGLG